MTAPFQCTRCGAPSVPAIAATFAYSAATGEWALGCVGCCRDFRAEIQTSVVTFDDNPFSTLKKFLDTTGEAGKNTLHQVINYLAERETQHV